MNETRFGLRLTLPIGYDDAVEQTVSALKAEG